MAAFLQDLRYTLRQWRRTPGFAAMAVLTLALGIGANTAIFLLSYTILLKGLPVPNPGQLVRYTFTKGEGYWPFSYEAYSAMRKYPGEMSGLFAWATGSDALVTSGHPQRISTGLATGSIFQVLQLKPYLGSTFSPDAGQPGAPFRPEAMLSYSFWRTHFDGNRRILGHAITLDTTSFTIVGILPKAFTGINAEEHIDALLPLSYNRVLGGKGAMMDNPGAFWLQIMGRLKPGATLASAQAAIQAEAPLIFRQADPKHEFYGKDSMTASYHFVLKSGRNGDSGLSSEYRNPLLALESLCSLMMLLCAVNTGLLLLSRVTSRMHEFAVRSALGAARRRLMAQVLTETLLLAAGGLALGGWLGWELAHGLVAILTPVGSAPLLSLKVGSAILLFSAGISVAAALLAGFWPAWRASRAAPMLELKLAGGSRGSHRVSRLILPVQVALGMVLLYAALLLTGTLRDYLKLTAGYNPNHLTMAVLNFPAHASDQDTAREALQLTQNLAAAPGVQSAALMNMPPLRGWSSSGGYFTLGRSGKVLSSDVWPQQVTPGYFATMGTQVLAGRNFQSSDIGGDRVCILSQSAAHLFFPNGNAVGRDITPGDGSPSQKASGAVRPCRVIGVVQNAHMQSLLSPAPLTVYSLMQQQKRNFMHQVVAVRAQSQALAAAAIRRAAAKYFPGTEPPLIYSFRQVVNADLNQQILLGRVSGGFALLALLLVATGLYGILSRHVTERRKDIGIRMALGAERGAIVRQLARTTAIRIAAGVLAGGALALVTGRLMHSLLYGLTFHSPAVVLATLVTLLGVLALAFVIPAARAASVDPAEAIREE